jgi:hypothetical protein
MSYAFSVPLEGIPSGRIPFDWAKPDLNIPLYLEGVHVDSLDCPFHGWGFLFLEFM